MTSINSSCDKTQIKYSGTGVRKNFPFTFTYQHFYDVKAALWDDITKEYVEQSNKYVLDPTGTQVVFLVAPETPPLGAPDNLNVKIYRDTNLDIMESVFYPGSSIRAQDLNDNFEQVQNAIVETKCGIASVSTDLDDRYVQLNDLVGYQNQIDGGWPEGDERIYGVPTTAGASARFDAYVQDSLPDALPKEQPGKTWQNTNKSHSAYWNEDAQAWVAYVNSGPRGAQGPEGKVGPQGPKGEGLKVTDSIDYPGPPSGSGSDNEFVIDSNGEGWFWDGSTWSSSGSLAGPQGPQGATGPQGPQGVPGRPGEGSGNIDSVKGQAPVFVDTTNSRNPVVTFDISLLTTLPA